MIEPVEFKFGKIEAGWCPLHISVPGQTDKIWCSAFFDPFKGLKRMMTDIGDGCAGSTAIDEEGELTIVRFDVEPGAFVGRLRIYEMDYNFEVDSAIEQARLDAEVDKIQLLVAFRMAYRDFISRYTSEDWYCYVGVGPGCRLDPLDLADIERTLMDAGAIAPGAGYLAQLDNMGDGQERREKMIRSYRNAVPTPVTAATSIWDEVMVRPALA